MHAFINPLNQKVFVISYHNTTNTAKDQNALKAQHMENPVLDLSYLQSISGNDSKYMYEVMNIFLTTVPDSLNKLEKLVKAQSDFEGIHRQAHSLKSSFSIIKVGDIFDNIAAIVLLGSIRYRHGGDHRAHGQSAHHVSMQPCLFFTAERDKNKN
jgi:hypothetical protein